MSSLRHDRNADFLAEMSCYNHNFVLICHSCSIHIPSSLVFPFLPVPLILVQAYRHLGLLSKLAVCQLWENLKVCFLFFYSRHFGKERAQWCLIYWTIVPCATQQGLREFQKYQVVFRNAKQGGRSNAGSIHIRDIPWCLHMAKASRFWQALSSLHCWFSLTVWTHYNYKQVWRSKQILT